MLRTVSRWKGRPSPLVRPRSLRMLAIWAWVWVSSSSSMAATAAAGVLRIWAAVGGTGVVRGWCCPAGGQVGGQLADPGLLGVGELPGVFLAGLVVGVLCLGEGAQGGVPAGFEGVGDEPVGGVDGEVAAAG